MNSKKNNRVCSAAVNIKTTIGSDINNILWSKRPRDPNYVRRFKIRATKAATHTNKYIKISMTALII